MRRFFGFAIVTAVLLGGCRLKGEESFLTATTPNPPGTWHGDQYGSVGLAEATGGTKTRTQYGKGANDAATAPLIPGFDEPAKGVGGHAGENPVRAAGGYGNSNSPANQASPGEVSPLSSGLSR